MIHRFRVLGLANGCDLAPSTRGSHAWWGSSWQAGEARGVGVTVNAGRLQGERLGIPVSGFDPLRITVPAHGLAPSWQAGEARGVGVTVNAGRLQGDRLAARKGSGSGDGISVGSGTEQVTPTPYTLHPTPYTLHPTPYTLNPEP
jgi:hypothetical protein